MDEKLFESFLILLIRGMGKHAVSSRSTTIIGQLYIFVVSGMNTELVLFGGFRFYQK